MMPKKNDSKALKLISKKTTKHRSGAVYQIKISLSGAPVPIWRRLVLSADIPLCVVHEIFQIAMGWWNFHLYDFEANSRHFGNLETADGDDRIEDDMKFTLQDLVAQSGDSFVYVYDFGDGWRHQVVLEDVIYPEPKTEMVACCVVGRRACPPEDVGGIGGYAEFLDIIEDPQNEERIERIEWAGGDFDPNSFDIRGVNLRLLELSEAVRELTAATLT